MRVLFLRNSAYFTKIKPSQSGKNSITDVGKACKGTIFNVANMSFNANSKNHNLVSEFTVFNSETHYMTMSMDRKI